MKRYLIFMAVLGAGNAWGGDQPLSVKLHLCCMSDGVKLDLPCIGKNMDATRVKIEEIVKAVAARDAANDIAPKLPKLAELGKDYAKELCSAEVEMTHGQYEACLVDRYVEVIRDISCVSYFPIRHDNYSGLLESYCNAPRSAAP
jgi:hypothetical protein